MTELRLAQENRDEKQARIYETESAIKRTEWLIRQAEGIGRDIRPLQNQLAGLRITKAQMEIEWLKLTKKVKRLKKGENDGLGEG